MRPPVALGVLAARSLRDYFAVLNLRGGRFTAAILTESRPCTASMLRYARAASDLNGTFRKCIFKYGAAYEDLKRASELIGGQSGDNLDLAEAALTSDHLDEAYDLASKILSTLSTTASPAVRRGNGQIR